MVFELKKDDVYECRYGTVTEDGKEVKPKKPVRVFYRFLSPAEHNSFFGWNPPVLTDGKMSQVGTNDIEGATRAMVNRLENCVVKVNGKKTPIDDIEKFYDAEGIPAALKMEIEGAMRTASAVVDTDPLG